MHLDLGALKVEARRKRQPRKTDARPSLRCGTPLRSLSGGLVVLWGCPGMSGGIHSYPMYTRRAWLNASRHVAMQWRRFGYSRVYDMRQGEFPGTNQKKVFRLCREQGLAVRKRNMGKKYRGERTPLVAATWVIKYGAWTLSVAR